MLRLFGGKRILLTKPQYWTCPRCGTTNPWGRMTCSQCKNRRPV